MKLLNLTQLHRLFTHEDAFYYHSHKNFAFLVLGNFIFRFFQWISVGHMNMHPIWFAIHAALHITSFNFKLQDKRNKAYNIIWPEMRWHTLIFAYRSILALYVQYLTNNHIISPLLNKLLRVPIVLGTIAIADYVTNYYSKQGTTMRDNPYPQWVSPTYIRYHNLFYSISQVLATMNILTQTNMGALFIILLPIQTAPFCMTLVKKGIIDQAGWHVYYTLALASNYLYNYLKHTGGLYNTKLYWILAIYFTYGRFVAKLNKYTLWSVVILINLALSTNV